MENFKDFVEDKIYFSRIDYVSDIYTVEINDDGEMIDYYENDTDRLHDVDYQGMYMELDFGDFYIEVDIFGEGEIAKYKNINPISIDSVFDNLGYMYKKSESNEEFVYRVMDLFLDEHIKIKEWGVQ